MIFQISPKLSVARDLPQTYRQTVPQTRPRNSRASITKSVVGSWKTLTRHVANDGRASPYISGSVRQGCRVVVRHTLQTLWWQSAVLPPIGLARG